MGFAFGLGCNCCEEGPCARHICIEIPLTGWDDFSFTDGVNGFSNHDPFVFHYGSCCGLAHVANHPNNWAYRFTGSLDNRSLLVYRFFIGAGTDPCGTLFIEPTFILPVISCYPFIATDGTSTVSKT